MTRRILITTGNGMFGRALIHALAGRDDIEIRAMVRDLSKFDVTAPNLEVVTGDLDDPASLVAPTRDVSHVFLTSPMDAKIADREIAVIDACLANGRPHVLDISGAVKHQGDQLDQLHSAAIESLKASGLPWTIISPNSVMETSLSAVQEQLRMGMFLGMSGHGKVGIVALTDVAAVMAEVVTTTGHEGQNYLCTGPETVDMPEFAAVLSQVLGRHIDYYDLSEAEFSDLLLEHGGYADRDQVEIEVLCHLRAWKEGRAEAVTHDVERITGRPAQSITQWVSQNRADFDARTTIGDRIAGALLKAKYHGRKLGVESV